jgi:hypothetical protein
MSIKMFLAKRNTYRQEVENNYPARLPNEDVREKTTYSFCNDFSYFDSLVLLKQSLQYTGLPSRGSNGTSVSLPHCAQVAGCISRALPPVFLCDFLDCRHGWHRFGSLVKPFVEKNSCS